LRNGAATDLNEFAGQEGRRGNQPVRHRSRKRKQSEILRKFSKQTRDFLLIRYRPAGELSKRAENSEKNELRAIKSIAEISLNNEQ
jgi:hypothetical protein